MKLPMVGNRLHPLILQSLQLETSPQTRQGFLALSQSEWSDLTREAIRLRLAHALQQFLRRNPDLARKTPERCRTQLQQVQRNTLMFNLKRQAQLRRMLDALEAEGIPCLLMKGLWIVEVLYGGNLAARQSGDIDLLFRPEDMPRFTRVAKALGFSVEASVEDLRALVPMGHEFPLQYPGEGMIFDIHWGMTHPVFEKSVDEARFWARSRNYTIAGRPCRSFELEDHLLLLSHHAVGHHRFQYVGPRALVDLAQAVSATPRPIDWPTVFSRARELGWDRGLGLMLDLVREIAGVSPPGEIMDQFERDVASDPQIRQLALEALMEDQDPREAIGSKMIRMLGTRPLTEKIRHLWDRLFPPPEFVLQYFLLTPNQLRGPGHLTWLQMRRWLIWGRTNLPKLLDLWRGDPVRRAELHRSARLQRWLED